MTDGTGSAVGIGGDSGVGGSAAGSDTFGSLRLVGWWFRLSWNPYGPPS